MTVMNTGNADNHAPQKTTDPSRLRIRSDVRFRIIDEEALILRQDDAEVLGLNTVGARVLEAIAAQQSLDNILAVLQDEFEVEPAQLEEDIQAFLDELQRHGVLEAVPDSEPSA